MTEEEKPAAESIDVSDETDDRPPIPPEPPPLAPQAIPPRRFQHRAPVVRPERAPSLDPVERIRALLQEGETK